MVYSVLLLVRGVMYVTSTRMRHVPLMSLMDCTVANTSQYDQWEIRLAMISKQHYTLRIHVSGLIAKRVYYRMYTFLRELKALALIYGLAPSFRRHGCTFTTNIKLFPTARRRQRYFGGVSSRDKCTYIVYRSLECNLVFQTMKPLGFVKYHRI
jgi:hypothetical protein